MSGIAALIRRLISAVGGGPTAAGLVIAGLVIGGLGGLALSSPGGTPAVPTGSLPIYPCPAQGPAMATVPGGQRMLDTGRTADGAWLRIHFPGPGRTEGWVEASRLRLEGETAGLEIATCAPEEAPTDRASASATLTAIGNNSPSPSPTPVPTPTPRPTASPRPTPTATPRPTPTPAPPNPAPTFLRLDANPKSITRGTVGCANSMTTKVVVIPRDADGIDPSTVILHYDPPGPTKTTTALMTDANGDGIYEVVVTATPNWGAGSLRYYVSAEDTTGKLGRSATLSNVTVC